jgi:malate dehydrogenase (oxaloacetate-decarboxylating)(NADP+)
MFLGAGSAATGIADLMTSALVDEGLSLDEARRRCGSWTSTAGREGQNGLMAHNRRTRMSTRRSAFVEAIDAVKPHVLIGATGGRARSRNRRSSACARTTNGRSCSRSPIPRRRRSARPQQAYDGATGAAVLASGSPFGAVTYGAGIPPGRATTPTCFPASGWGASCAARASFRTSSSWRGPDARGLVEKGDLQRGSLYPPLRDIRRISLAIAVSVAGKAYELGLARARRPRNLGDAVARFMYEP